MPHPRPLAGLTVLLLLVVLALPGTMSAASAPASPPGPAHRVPSLVEPDERLAERVLSVPAPLSVFEGAQVVSLYGYPSVPRMGALGAYPPEQAADEAARIAALYDALNGDRAVVPALHLIVAVAQPRPTSDGDYLGRLSMARIEQYVEVARERGLLLFLDVQVGWANPIDEVRRLSKALAEPFVHLALDPEFATRARGVAPGAKIGSLAPAEVNAVQAYLAALVRAYRLPPKALVLHQFLPRMLQRPDQYWDFPEVEVTVDMDGFGGERGKFLNYQSFALAPYAERAGLKLFFDRDTPLLSPEWVQSLPRPPDLVIYQ